MSRRLIALIFGALAVGLIAGCGSSSSGSDSTSSLTKAEFIKKSDAICTKARDKVELEFEAYVKKHGLVPDSEAGPARVVAAETILIPALHTELEEIQALGAPSGDEDTIGTIMDEAEKGLGEIEDNAAKLTGRPPALETANNLAHKYGFKVCVQA